MSFLLRRLLRAFLLLIGVSVLCFAFTQMAPGSLFDEMRLNPQISPETIATLQAHYGLDLPLPVRYAKWVLAAARGDFGYSIAYNSPVGPLLWTRAKNTLLLNHCHSSDVADRRTSRSLERKLAWPPLRPVCGKR
jgi:peptide/nickel transport system permease protein